MKARLANRRPLRRASIAIARRPVPLALRRFIGFLRLLVVGCALQLSGSSHVIVDLIQGTEAGCIDTCSSPCEDEQEGRGCPPDCPDCSCPHGRLPSLPPSLALALPEQFAWDLLETWVPSCSGEPTSPPLSLPYRPPRA